MLGALENPSLTDEKLLRLLRNPHVTPQILSRIGRDRRWTRVYEIKRALVRHPRSPLVVSRGFLPYLHWKDLAEACADLRVHPVARRQAERLLGTRVDELSLGEKVTLARRASRGLIRALIDAGEPQVLRGLLGNERTVEADAIRIASGPRATPELLRHLADHPKWGRRRDVRLALLRNRRTPVPVALRLAGGLAPPDLRRLLKDDKVPRIVRVGAERRLADS